MAIQLDAYQWIMLLVTVIGTVFGTIKLLWSRIEQSLDNKFQNVQNKLDDVAKQSEKNQKDIHELEREFFKHLMDLPHKYVAREDYIRGQAVIESKLDAVAEKLETVQIRQGIQTK